MGNGRHSGLPKGIKSFVIKDAHKFKITSKSARQFGIKLVAKRSKKVDQNVVNSQLDQALETIGRACVLLGINPQHMPAVELQYGSYSLTARGDAIIRPEYTDQEDARIRLHDGTFYGSLDTAAHEYVHAVEAWLINSNFQNVWARRNAWADHTYSDAICRNALIKLGKQSDSDPGLDRKAWKTEALKLQRTPGDTYGASKTCETLSTSMQIVLRRGESAPAFAKAVVEATREAVQDTYKHLKIT